MQFSCAKEVVSKLQYEGFRVELDDRSEKIGYKIREAHSQKIPYLIILGDQEQDEKTITIRGRGNENTSGLILEDFIERLHDEVKNFKK